MRHLLHPVVPALFVLACNNDRRSHSESETPSFEDKRLSGFLSIHLPAHKSSLLYRLAVEHCLPFTIRNSASHPQNGLREILQSLGVVYSDQLYPASHDSGTCVHRARLCELHK